MKPNYFLLPTFFLMILLLASPAIGFSDWVEYGRSDLGDIYLYHSGSMKQKTQDIVHVWVKIVFSAEGRKDYMLKLRNSGESTEGYEKLSHSLSLVEIDRKRPRFRILYGSEYDTDDKELFRGSREAPWKEILPNTTQEILKKQVCR